MPEEKFAEAAAAERRAAKAVENEALRQKNAAAAAVAQAAREAEQATARAKHSADNEWLIDAIYGQPGDFVASMVEKLENNAASSLSDRMLDILSDIYAKQVTNGARRGTKRYDAAVEEFDSHFAQEPVTA